jgi:hypothetical protein
MNIADRGLKQELTLDVLRRHGRCRLQVCGTSMLPTLWPGDTVSIENRPLADMRVGDIVFYERGGRLYLHRLVALPAEKFPGRLLTRGDSMPHADPAVRLDGVLGVLEGVRRGEDWVAVPRTMTPISRLTAWLARSSGLVRLVLRIRSIPKTFSGAPSWTRFFFHGGAGRPSGVDAPPEVPTS